MNLNNPRIRGSIWLTASTLFCPCHLPFTIPLILGLTAGTALGAVLASNVWVIGAVSTLMYLGGLLVGFRYLRQKNNSRRVNAANEADTEFACCIHGETDASANASPRRVLRPVPIQASERRL